MRIAIIGSHCTGKTSLMDKLSSKIDFIGYNFYPEVVRELEKYKFPFNKETDDCSQLAMLSLHLLHLKDKNMITDRCVLDNYVYAYMLKNNNSKISSKCIDILQYYFIDSIFKYDIYAFCPIEFKMKKDGFRMTDKKLQEEISEEILRTILQYVPKENYILLSGETDERVKQLIEFKNAKEKLK